MTAEWESDFSSLASSLKQNFRDMSAESVSAINKIIDKLEDIPKMKALGYEEHFDACRPTAKDAFNPKTVLTYGEIQKGFNLWEERW